MLKFCSAFYAITFTSSGAKVCNNPSWEISSSCKFSVAIRRSSVNSQDRLNNFLQIDGLSLEVGGEFLLLAANACVYFNQITL